MAAPIAEPRLLLIDRPVCVSGSVRRCVGVLLAFAVRRSFRAPLDEDAARRHLTRWIAALGGLTFVTGLVALMSFLTIRPLFLETEVQRVQGRVIQEESGPFGIWNELTVEYEVRGESFTRTIPVKGPHASSRRAGKGQRLQRHEARAVLLRDRANR